MTGKDLEIGDEATLKTEGLNLSNVAEEEVVEVVGNMRADSGNFAVVDVGGEHGLVAVSWSRLRKL